MNKFEIGSIVTITGRLTNKGECCSSTPVTLFEVKVENTQIGDDVKVMKPRPEIGTYVKHRTGRIEKLVDINRHGPILGNYGGADWMNVFDLSETELKIVEVAEKEAKEAEWRKQLEKIPVDLLMEAIKQRVK